MRPLRERLRAVRGDGGFTLIELLIASAMSIVILAGISAMVVGVMRAQPEVSKRAQNISSARWMLERFIHELRNGVVVVQATPSEVSFRTYVRHASCGSSTALASTSPAIQCKVTYRCTATSCSRGEAAPESAGTGTMTTVFSGIDDPNVFTYSPDSKEPTFVEVTLHIPNPSGSADLTVSDGASLRNATLQN